MLIDERGKGASQKLAAARAGVSERTARKYEQAGKFAEPDEEGAQAPHARRPFAGDWAWVEARIRDDPALQTKTSRR